MAVVYRTTDRITIKIQDVEFKIAPLPYAEKIKIKSSLARHGGANIEDISKTSIDVIRYSVKEVKGLMYADGSELKLELDESGNLTDESVNELMNIEMSENLVGSVIQLMNKITNKIVDENGEEIKGIKIVLPKAKGLKVKK